MHYRSEDWSGTISFWMRLDPDKDLQPGYCDPLQVTQFAWNNGSFFVDFDKDLPRDFRLGVFSDLKFWNPENIDWEKLPVEKRPMVTVKKPPFSRESGPMSRLPGKTSIPKVKACRRHALREWPIDGIAQWSHEVDLGTRQICHHAWDRLHRRPGRSSDLLGVASAKRSWTHQAPKEIGRLIVAEHIGWESLRPIRKGRFLRSISSSTEHSSAR